MEDFCDDHSGFSLDVDSLLWSGGEVEVVPTAHGPLMVTIRGDRRKPGLITYHDIGLNHASCFQGLFLCAESSSLLLDHFCVYHIDSPGHEVGARELQDGQGPVTVEEMAEQVEQVADYFELMEVLCLGVGAGAYILTLFAVQNTSRVSGLILISPTCQQAGWGEWAYNKALLNLLYYYGMTSFVKESLLYRYFGPESRGFLGPGSNVVQTYRRELDARDPINVMRYLQAMQDRHDLTPFLHNLHCNTLLIVGEKSPAYEDAVHMETLLDHRKSAWVEIPGCGALLTEECPAALHQPIQLFLMELGYYSPPHPITPTHAICPGPRAAMSYPETSSYLCSALPLTTHISKPYSRPPTYSHSQSTCTRSCPSPPQDQGDLDSGLSRTSSSLSTNSNSSSMRSVSTTASTSSTGGSMSPAQGLPSSYAGLITASYTPFAPNPFSYEEFSPGSSGLKLKPIRTRPLEKVQGGCARSDQSSG